MAAITPWSLLLVMLTALPLLERNDRFNGIHIPVTQLS
jgi:hypothetical protein